MTIVIFCGPTIGREALALEIEAELLPPAGRGDVLRAALGKPAAIGLIDGCFHEAPAVWHKEILWAMREGIHVFGAASMGALRAAELDSFGMVGVGVVYEAFHSGALQDDDEVAVAHASADFGYRNASEAMVNVRATLRAAREAAVIDEDSLNAFVRIAKTLMYPDRCYARILAVASEEGVSTGEVGALRDWLPRGRVDQKGADALAMARLMKARAEGGWARKEVTYSFSHTDAWESLERDVIPRALGARFGGSLVAVSRRIAEELLLNGEGGANGDGAVARAACLDHARRLQVKTDAQSFEAFVEEFRRDRGLLRPVDFESWLADQGLKDDEDVAAYFEREALFQRVKAWYAPERLAASIDHLRAKGSYAVLAARAEAKARLLTSRGLDQPELRDTGLSEEALWGWFFRGRLGRETPINVESYARREGSTAEQLRSAVIREFVYLRLSGLKDDVALHSHQEG